MKSISDWHIEDTIYRGSPGRSFGYSLSCGFLNKSGWTEDISDERYDRFAMIYLLNGRGWYRDDRDQEIELRAGDIFFRCPDRIHSTWVDPQSNWRETFVSVRSLWYELFRSMELIPEHQVRFSLGEAPHLPEQVLALMKRLRDADTPHSNVEVEFDIVALMRWVLSHAQETHETSTPRMELLTAARERIRQKATSRDGLETILNGAGLSYSRLRSLFRQAYGTGPGEYRVQVRIEQACALLETTTDNMQEIADHLGYSDAFAFSKQFKQHVGVSPSAFRKRRVITS